MNFICSVHICALQASQQKIVRLLVVPEPCNLEAIISAVIGGYIVRERV